MARTLMDLMGFGSPSVGSTSSPVGRTPTPMPAPERAWNKNAGIIGNMFGIADNPIYQATRPMVQDLGYGLSQGTNWQDGLSIAARRSAQMAPGRKQDAEDEENRIKYAQIVSGFGEEYEPFAAGIAEGAIDPGEGYWKALEFKEQRDKEGEARSRSAANAQFLSDPNLRSMVESGALDFETAYKYQAGGADGNVTYGLNPIYGQLEDGTMGMGVMGDDGTLKRVDTGGMTPLGPYDTNALKAAGTAYGKRTGQAQFDVPAAELTMQETLGAIQDIRGNKAGMEEQFGMGGLQQILPAWPGTEKANFRNSVARGADQAFLQAREMLRGGGQITDFEGRKAENAITNMTLASESGNKAAFEAALDDFEQAVQAGYSKLVEQSGTMPGFGGRTGGAAPQPHGGTYATNPTTGERLELVNGQWMQAR